MNHARLQRGRGKPRERVPAATAHTRYVDRLISLQRTVGNHAVTQAASRQLARSPNSDNLERAYNRVILASQKSGADAPYVGLLVNLNELFDASTDADPDVGRAVVRIIKRITGLAYQNWYDADGRKRKDAVADEVRRHVKSADYTKMNSNLAADIMDPITTLLTSFHSGGGEAFQKEAEWGTAIVTGHVKKLSA
jgi:hypothetical protein